MIFGFKTRKDRKIKELENELEKVREENKRLSKIPRIEDYRKKNIDSQDIELTPCRVYHSESIHEPEKSPVSKSIMAYNMCDQFKRFICDNAKIKVTEDEHFETRLYEMTVLMGFPK